MLAWLAGLSVVVAAIFLLAVFIGSRNECTPEHQCDDCVAKRLKDD